MDAGIEHRRKTWKVLLFLWLLLAAVNIGVGAWFGFDARTLSPVAVALGSACLAVSSIQHSKSRLGAYRIWMACAWVGIAVGAVLLILSVAGS